jgi:hypothetical protein
VEAGSRACGKLMGPAPLQTEQSSFMAKRKQQPARKRFAIHAKFAAKAKMGVRAALKLDLRPAEEDRQALLKCLRKWLGEAKALRGGASGGQVWSGSQDFSKGEGEGKGEGVRIDFTGAGRGLVFFVDGKLVYQCDGPTGAMDKGAAGSRKSSNVRHAQ